jgi:hypothetical protein
MYVYVYIPPTPPHPVYLQFRSRCNSIGIATRCGLLEGSGFENRCGRDPLQPPRTT